MGVNPANPKRPRAPDAVRMSASKTRVFAPGASLHPGHELRERAVGYFSLGGELPTVAPLGWITPQAMRPPASPAGSDL